MTKIARKPSNGKFSVASKGGKTIVRDNKSGRAFPLKGYGIMKGEFEVIKGIDLTKPIAAQVKLTKRPKSAVNEPAKRH